MQRWRAICGCALGAAVFSSCVDRCWVQEVALFDLIEPVLSPVKQPRLHAAKTNGLRAPPLSTRRCEFSGAAPRTRAATVTKNANEGRAQKPARGKAQPGLGREGTGAGRQAAAALDERLTRICARDR